MPKIIENEDYINIFNGSSFTKKSIDTRCVFFEDAEYFSFYYNEYLSQLKIVKHRLNVPKKTSKKYQRSCDGRYRLSVSLDLPNGQFYFDKDESNDDVAIIYFDNN